MRMNMKTILWILLYSFIVLSGCNNHRQNPPKIKAAYKPPLLPVRLVIDADGNVYAEGDASIVTPIGEFSIGAELPIRQKNSRVIIVRNTKKGTFKAARIKTSSEHSSRIDTRAVIVDVPKSSAKSVQIASSGEVIVKQFDYQATPSHTIQNNPELNQLTFTGNWLIDQGVIKRHAAPGTNPPGPTQLDRQTQIKLMQEMAKRNRAEGNHRFP